MLDRATRSRMFKQLPATLLATALLLTVPSLLVWGLHGSVVSVPALWSILIASGLSALLCHLGARLWAVRRGSDERLFADLMLWAWVRRWLLERRVSNAMSVLGLDPRHDGSSKALTPPERLQLLCQLASDLEARDPFVRGHSRRVARYASLIASRMRLPRSEVERVRAAAALHDIGKLHTPLSILHKPGTLTKEEFGVVKRHSAVGARIVQVLVEDSKLASIVRHHHERLDGTGYPGGLAGDDIPLGSRIIAVADTFDAITAHRPYRAARPHRVALDILRAESGTQLDPDVVHAFQGVYRGERPLSALVAVTNGAERLLSSLASSVSGITLPAAGIAAATALGTAGQAAVRHLPASRPPATRQLATSPHTTAAGQTLRVAFHARTTSQSHNGGKQRASLGSTIRATGSNAAAPASGVASASAPTNPASTSPPSAPPISAGVNSAVTGATAGVAVATSSGSTTATLSEGHTLGVSATVTPNQPVRPAAVGVSAPAISHLGGHL